MSINSARKLGKPFFTLSRTVDTFVMVLTLLAGGFVLNPIASITDTFAQEKSNDTTESATVSNTTTSEATPSSLRMALLQDLVYQEDEKLVSQIPINQTHAELIVSGNGTLTLPNATETIRTTATKTGVVSMIDGTFAGKEILTTAEDGSENASATIYEIVRFNMESGNGTGIAMALFHTNSTELLAPLDGMILTGQGELHTDATGVYSLWKWKIGIPR